jgi:AraC-like DNA-binding protein
MQYQEQLPSADLSTVIKHFWYLEYRGGEPQPETILPDGCPEIVFNLADRFRRIDAEGPVLQPTALLAGQISRGITIMPTGNVRLFGVRLRPTGAFMISGIRQAELMDKLPCLDEIFGNKGKDLEDAINTSADVPEMASAVEDFVLSALSHRKHAADAAGTACDIIAQRKGAVPVSSLAKELGRSERSLERDFREHVGLSPKLFARIVRFQTAVRQIENATEQKMIEAALASGYFDQPHMIRDFREFAGKSPLEYFNAHHQISAFFTS